MLKPEFGLGQPSSRAHFFNTMLHWHAYHLLTVRTIYVPGYTKPDLVENRSSVKHPNSFSSWIWCVTQGERKCKRADTVYDLCASYNCLKKNPHKNLTKCFRAETSHFLGLSYTFWGKVTTIFMCVKAWKLLIMTQVWGKITIYVLLFLETYQNMTLKITFFFFLKVALFTSPDFWLVAGVRWEMGNGWQTEIHPFKVTEHLVIKQSFQLPWSQFFNVSPSPFFPSLWVAAKGKRNVHQGHIFSFEAFWFPIGLFPSTWPFCIIP